MAAQFSETRWIWRNGDIIAWEEANIHVMSHAVHYGSSIFEGIRCYRTPSGPAIFRLGDHIRRFMQSARVYRMDSGFEEETLSAACVELVARNGLQECYLRPLMIRGYGAAGLHPAASPVETYIVCWPWGAYLGEGALERGVDACVSSWQRPAPNTHPVLAKAGGNYLSSQLIKMEAVEHGYDEGIALSRGGLVSEASGQNIFLVRDGALVTPAVDGTLLEGITRDCVFRLAEDLAIPVRERSVPREMLYTADEIFLTGTAAEITPVRSVDRIPIGRSDVGPITRALQERLLSTARGRGPDPRGWLTPVGSPPRAGAGRADEVPPASPGLTPLPAAE